LEGFCFPIGRREAKKYACTKMQALIMELFYFLYLHTYYHIIRQKATEIANYFQKPVAAPASRRPTTLT